MHVKYPHAYKTDETYTYRSKYTFKFYPVGLVTLFNYAAIFTDLNNRIEGKHNLKVVKEIPW